MRINFLNDVKVKKRLHREAGLRASGSGPSAAACRLLACCLWLLCLVLPALPCSAAELAEVGVRLENNELYVTASLKPDPKIMEELNAGLTKELVFYLDLFRVWSVWPDEFVLGKKIVRVIKSNPIKREHVAGSIDGVVHLEKRFKDLDAMVDWAVTIPELKLTNVRELESGLYFVKVTVESKVRKLPPVIGPVISIFLRDKEFTLEKDSPQFMINGKAAP